MTSINSKLGLKAAGQRSMMKLPDDRALRSKLTAAVCPAPACGQRGARLSRLKGQEGWFTCSWCNHAWNPDA
jgi:hypothetical protein